MLYSKFTNIKQIFLSGQTDFHLSKDSDDNGYTLYILEKNYKVYNIFQFHFNLNLLRLENLT